MTLYILLALLVFVLIFIVFIYNKLLKFKVLVDEGWSGIDVQLKRRYDLIPNLVGLVQAYATKEKEILVDVTRLRSEAMNSTDITQKAGYEDQLGATLKNLIIIVEAYPEIKSNENFLKLQNQFVEIEDNIQLARRYYNGTVRNYNTQVQVFPNTILAKVFNFNVRSFFEAEDAARKDVKW
jgi:LemA protein